MIPGVFFLILLGARFGASVLPTKGASEVKGGSGPQVAQVSEATSSFSRISK